MSRTALRPDVPQRGHAHHPNGCYVYGVVPAGTVPACREASVLAHRQVAALVRPAAARPVSRGRRALLSHAEVLDRTALASPVLPMRFGTVLASPEEVERELLAPHHDTFVAALAQLAGRAQFTVRARYLSEAILREVLDHDPRAGQLHRQRRRREYDHAARVSFGEAVAKGVLARREIDAQTLADWLRPHAAATSVTMSQSLEGYRVGDAACLVDIDRRGDFESAVEDLAGRWRQRVRLRLLGPMAAYHFADQLTGVHTGGR